MQTKDRNISAPQLIILLFVSRIFSLMTYVPPGTTGTNGSAALLSNLFTGLLAGVLILPFLFLTRKCATDPLTCAFRVSRSYGVGVSVLFLLFCLFLAAGSVTQFEFFMTSTTYQGVRPWIFIFGLTVVAVYGAYLGLEAFSRMAMLVFFLVIAMLTILIVVLIPEMELVYLHNPLWNDLRTVLTGTLRSIGGFGELVLFMLLIGRTSGKKGRTFALWISLVVVVYEVLTFVMLTALGDYVRTRLFPLYTAASMAQLSVFGRLDLFHIIVWVFAAFLRATLYLYSANLCLRRIFPKLPYAVSATLCGVITWGGALCMSIEQRFPSQQQTLYVLGIPLFVLVVLFPLITLLLPGIQAPGGEKGESV